jgi:hypothetical protein
MQSNRQVAHTHTATHYIFAIGNFLNGKRSWAVYVRARAPPNFKKSFAGSSKASHAKLPGRAPGIVHGEKLAARNQLELAEWWR